MKPLYIKMVILVLCCLKQSITQFWAQHFERTSYDTFRSLGKYIDSFEIILDYTQRSIEHEVANRPKVDVKYVDFVVRQRHVSIKRSPLSLTYINHNQQNVTLRNAILKRVFRVNQKFTVNKRRDNVVTNESFKDDYGVWLNSNLLNLENKASIGQRRNRW